MTQAKYFDYDEKEDYEEEEITPPRRPGDAPDGGWGWRVVLGAFVCNMFVEGFIFSWAVVRTEIANELEVAEQSLLDIGVFMASFMLIGGE